MSSGARSSEIGRAMAEVNRHLLVFDHHAGRLVQDPEVFRGDAEAAAVDQFRRYREAWTRIR